MVLWGVKSLSHVGLFATPWTVAYQAPLSMDFSRQEYWNQGGQGSRGCFPDASGESVLVSRGSKGLRSPLQLQWVSLGAH